MNKHGSNVGKSTKYKVQLQTQKQLEVKLSACWT